MKNYYLLIIALLFSFSLEAQIIDFPDPNFKNALVNTNCVDIDGDSAGDSDADIDDDGEISIAEAEAVVYLHTIGRSISSLEGINAFSNIQVLNVTNNNLTSLDLSGLTNLVELICENNDFSSLDVSTFSGIETLQCYSNQLTALDVSTLSNLTTLYCSDNQLTSLNVNGLQNLNHLSCGANELTSLDISSLTNLEVLEISSNQFTEIDVSSLTNLESLNISNNQFTEIDVSSLPNNLTRLIISSNQITELNVSTLTQLERLSCPNNQITTLDVSALTNLNYLNCGGNYLTELDITNLTNLEVLYCYANQLTELDVTGNPFLRTLECEYNQITFLDLSNKIVNPHRYLCQNNQIETLIIKNGVIDYPNDLIWGAIDFSNNPITYVCADNDEFDIINGIFSTQNLNNYEINSYCSFVPGGTYYTVEGSTHLDSDGNGCTVDDAMYSNLNFSITDGAVTGAFIANSSGEYSIPVQEGSHTITPTLETPEYFSVSPSSITVNFPADASPYVQNFCVTANGVYNDLEIAVLPLEAARPGFDTNYKMIYKNKGTTTLSGSVGLSFQDDLMDFVVANPAPDSQASGSLSWNFSDLTPFEVREIPFTMSINAPTDTPPVNGDDVLVFEGSVNHSETDETPDDNTTVFNQTVINSYDPNDKTCLQGDYITPEEVGKYVDYLIRFENTGTASAVNIVVKDDIDVSKYDLSTLVPLHASHDYFARVKDQGDEHYIEFIFEDINLPFDDANNDGYVAFKIKTLETLVLGDSFDNNAEIYFDYNFPIITDEATTTVAALSIDEFVSSDNDVVLYPNPTTNILNLESKQPIEHVTIFDVSGRVIQEIAIVGSKNNMTLSTENLTTGSYFVKLQTAHGDIVKKIIKE